MVRMGDRGMQTGAGLYLSGDELHGELRFEFSVGKAGSSVITVAVTCPAPKVSNLLLGGVMGWSERASVGVPVWAGSGAAGVRVHPYIRIVVRGDLIMRRRCLGPKIPA
jgi:hypothetical protein